MTLLEILLAATAVTLATPLYLRGVRATAVGSLQACRFALVADERGER